jgi:putative transposase
MDCVACGSAAVTERPEHTARGYRRFRCRDCGKQYNERSGGLLNHTHYPSDVIALVVLWHLRYRLTLRDLAEMFLQRGIVFSHEAVRVWEAKLAPVLADELRRHRHGRGGARARHWHVDETYLKIRGRWCYLYRAIDRDGNLVDTMLSEHRDMAAAQAFLPLGQGRHRRDARARHHGWSWLLPTGDPHRARPAGCASDQCI